MMRDNRIKKITKSGIIIICVFNFLLSPCYPSVTITQYLELYGEYDEEKDKIKVWWDDLIYYVDNVPKTPIRYDIKYCKSAEEVEKGSFWTETTSYWYSSRDDAYEMKLFPEGGYPEKGRSYFIFIEAYGWTNGEVKKIDASDIICIPIPFNINVEYSAYNKLKFSWDVTPTDGKNIANFYEVYYDSLNTPGNYADDEIICETSQKTCEYVLETPLSDERTYLYYVIPWRKAYSKEDIEAVCFNVYCYKVNQQCAYYLTQLGYSKDFFLDVNYSLERVDVDVDKDKILFGTTAQFQFKVNNVPIPISKTEWSVVDKNDNPINILEPIDINDTTKGFLPLLLGEEGIIKVKYGEVKKNFSFRIVYNLSGRVKYANRDGSESIDVPEGIKARITAENKECIIGSNGTYSFEKLFNPKFEIKLEPKLDKIKIVKTVTPEEILDISVNAKVDEIKGGKYVYYNETQQKFIVDVVLDKSNGNRAAFNILTLAKMGYDYAKPKGLTQQLTIVWYYGYDAKTPEGKYTSYYSDNKIHLLSGGNEEDRDEWDDSVILHEVGHFVNDNLVPHEYITDKQKAYVEGWASFYSSRVREENG